jgi:DmsE family decaheme c-type cytochrome
MKYWQRLPIFYLLAVLITALVVPFAQSGWQKNAAQETKPPDQAKPPNQAKQQAKASDQTKAYVAPTDPDLYVGSDTCKGCHEEIYTHFATTAHFATTMDGKLDAHKGVEWQGCESCHGPGKEHVDGGGDKSKIFTFKDATPQQTSARCLRCHQYTEEHGNYDRSMHLANGVACIDCHSPHQAKESQFLMKQKTPQLCYGCHQDVRVQFGRPFHHRVNEGLIQCNDCHNPHGGFQPKQLRTNASGDAVCLNCHTEKQGPFVYHHEALLEGCVTCHTPHGSTNQRLLQQNQVNLLCLGCHSLPADADGPPGTPSFHNQSTKYQSCTLCHVAIHGSNTSNVFFTP